MAKTNINTQTDDLPEPIYLEEEGLEIVEDQEGEEKLPVVEVESDESVKADVYEAIRENFSPEMLDEMTQEAILNMVDSVSREYIENKLELMRLDRTFDLVQEGLSPDEANAQAKAEITWETVKDEALLVATYERKLIQERRGHIEQALHTLNESEQKEIERQKKEVARLQALTERKAKETAYREARIDTLTHLANRRGFKEIATRQISQANRSNTSLSMLLIDLDKFKNINDTYNHEIGDIALKVAADIIKSAARESDTVARWGGEEFAVILPATDAFGAYAAGEKIRQKIEEEFTDRLMKAAPEANIDPNLIDGTASIGVSSIEGQNSMLAETERQKKELFNTADDKLYSAKHSGRNMVRVQDPGFSEGLLEDEAIEQAQAINSDIDPDRIRRAFGFTNGENEG